MTAIQTEVVDFGRRSGLKVHPVSIGAMRLPEDDDEAVALLRQAIDAGMIYIDTSRGYGDSEIKVGKALKDGYREKVILSTKCSPWLMKVEPDDDHSAECTYKRILESMQRLDVEYLDFYQVWNVNSRPRYELAVMKGGMVDGIKRAMKEGLVRHAGFTTHDTPENVSDYIDEADWCEAILLTYNLLNQRYAETIAKARAKGIATIVMNPLGGGMLAEDSPVIRAAVREAIGSDDVTQVAHRYLASNEDIDTIICGISKPPDVVSTLENYRKPPLTKQEIEALEAAMRQLSSGSMGFCTACGYCLPCPEGINIPAMMNVSYLAHLLDVPRKAEYDFNWATGEVNPDHCALPSACVECGQCESRCTQKLPIIEELKRVAATFERS
ncbi:MAG: aldo/keto reductase [Sedimentisphaerales bacterium]|nr:aldo/keto reductase [Sedimentisphaerales bacterium]